MRYYRLEPGTALTLEQVTEFVAAFFGDVAEDNMPEISRLVPSFSDDFVEKAEPAPTGDSGQAVG